MSGLAIAACFMRAYPAETKEIGFDGARRRAPSSRSLQHPRASTTNMKDGGRADPRRQGARYTAACPDVRAIPGRPVDPRSRLEKGQVGTRSDVEHAFHAARLR